MPFTLASLAIAALCIGARWVWLAGMNPSEPIDASAFSDAVFLILFITITVGLLLDFRVKMAELQRKRAAKEQEMRAALAAKLTNSN